MAPVVKNPPANTEDIRDADSIPGWGRSPGGDPVFLRGDSHGELLSIGSQRVRHD